MYKSDNPLFKDLDDKEEKEFRDYAKENDCPDRSKMVIYHPVCVQEWNKRGIMGTK